MYRPGVLGIDHVGVVVRDLQEAIADWQARFGATLLGEETLDHLGIVVAYLGIEGQPMVQLVEPIDGPLAVDLKNNGEGLHHICYAVNDIANTAASMANGEPVNIVRGGRGRLACFLPQRNSNVKIELTEASPSF